jgi:hypothetical protein
MTVKSERLRWTRNVAGLVQTWNAPSILMGKLLEKRLGRKRRLWKLDESGYISSPMEGFGIRNKILSLFSKRFIVYKFARNIKYRSH